VRARPPREVSGVRLTIEGCTPIEVVKGSKVLTTRADAAAHDIVGSFPRRIEHAELDIDFLCSEQGAVPLLFVVGSGLLQRVHPFALWAFTVAKPYIG
jgi:hypothetical protein